MNDPEPRLKKQVERIVRPIEATDRRKMKMREELLGHLLTAHEAARQSGEVDAVAAAISQLGDPEALREELQSSVPRVERLQGGPLLTAFFGHMEAVFNPGNTSPWRSTVLSGWYFMVNFFVYLAPLALVVVFGATLIVKGFVPWSMILKFGGEVFFIGFAGGVCLVLGIGLFRVLGLHRVANVKSGAPAMLQGALATVLSCGVVAVFLITLGTLSGEWPPGRTWENAMEFGGLLARQPVFYALALIYWGAVSWSIRQERRRYEEWEGLELE